MDIKIPLSKRCALSYITADMAQVFFAGLVVGQLIEKDLNLITVSSGLLLSLGFWGVSLQLANE